MHLNSQQLDAHRRQISVLICLFALSVWFLSLGPREKRSANCFLIASFDLCQAAQAKIGDPIQSFESKFSRIFTLKDSSSKDGNTYYRFSLNKDPVQQKAAPGFAGGMTITCANGKIQGESLVVRLGKNVNIGKAFTVGLSLDLTYEALGKPIVTDKKEAAAEYRSYLNAVDQALTGSPQDIKYAGYNTRITLSQTNSGDILLAIIPNPPTTQITKGKATIQIRTVKSIKARRKID